MALVALNLSLFAQPDSFQGVIIYERKSSRGQLSIETYYFGNQKLRVDKEVYSDTDVHNYSSIFDLSGSTNYYYKSNNGSSYGQKEITQSYTESFDLYPDSNRVILNRNCILSVLRNEPLPDYGSVSIQSRYHAQGLVFTIPKGWLLEYGMSIVHDNRIALYMRDEIHSENTDEVKSSILKALAIIPKKLPESVFKTEDR